MNPIDRQLQQIKSKGKIGLMTHVVVGYPSLEITERLILAMEKAGVDLVELQIPFSDPLADGPTIMRACEKALENGTKVKDAFNLAARLSRQVKIPLLFMAYYNTVFKYGTKKFCQDAKKVGISGVIIPDIPVEEENEEHFIKYCRAAGLRNIRVLSPASTQERIAKNTQIGDGFVYCTARQGITGAKEQLDPEVVSFLKKVGKCFTIPVAVGFGISKKEHLKMLSGHADIAVIGSAVIDLINTSGLQSIEEKVVNFIGNLTA